MKHSIKNYLETVTGCPVHMGKINYRKDGSLSRTITVMNNDTVDEDILDAVADNIRSSAPTTEVLVLNSNTMKVVSRESWRSVEESFNIAVDWTVMEVDAEPVEEELTSSLDIEAILDNLHVGMNVTPLGVGYASDEEDLKKMKQFLAGALAMAKILGM